MRVAIERDWTIMLYTIADDKDLRQRANDTLLQVKTASTSQRVKTVAQVTLASYASPSIRRFDFEEKLGAGRATDRQNHLQFIAQKDTGPRNNLTSYLKWAQTAYPAKRYCVILQGHASGVDFSNPSLSLTERKSKARAHPLYRLIFGNPYSATRLSNEELKDALCNSLNGNYFDILGIDSCLMCMAEIYYDLKYCARYLIASEGLAPIRGWPIGTIVSQISASSHMTARRVGNVILNDYGRTYAHFGGATKMTTSLCSLAQADTLCRAVRSLTSALLRGLGNDVVRTAIIHARSSSPYYTIPSYVDLYDYCSRLRRMPGTLRFPEIGAACKGVEAAVRGKVVLRRRLTHRHHDSHGLSIFFPNWAVGRKTTRRQNLSRFSPLIVEYTHPRTMEDALEKLATAYSDREFADRSGWMDFLRAYLDSRKA